MANTPNALTNYAKALKYQYPDKKMIVEAGKLDPFLQQVSKKTISGRKLIVPIATAVGQNISSQFSYAVTADTQDSFEEFQLTWHKHYGVNEWENDMMLAGRGDQILTNYASMKYSINATLAEMRRDLAFALWNGTYVSGSSTSANDGYYAKARAWGTSGASGHETEITLTNRADLVKFRKNMKVQLWTVDKTSSHAPGTGFTYTKDSYYLVSSIDISNKKLTLTKVGSAPTPGASTEYLLFRHGDHEDPGLHGVPEWIPVEEPTAADFTGVNRSGDYMLSGLRYDGSTAGSLPEAIADALGMSSAMGATGAKQVVINSFDFNDFVQQLEAFGSANSTIRRMDSGARDKKATFFFSTITVITDYGPVEVVGSPWVPKGLGWALDLSSWELRRLPGSGLPGLITIPNARGETLFRSSASADTWQIRIGWYAELVCLEPGKNTAIILP